MNNLDEPTALLRRIHWWLVGGMLVGLVLLFCFVYRRNAASYQALYRTTFAGKIRSIASSNHGLSVSVAMDTGQPYNFFPSRQQGGASGFLAQATVGNSLQKKPFSDTVLLLAHGQTVRFRFDKVLY
jgi:hypothetical protein